MIRIHNQQIGAGLYGKQGYRLFLFIGLLLVLLLSACVPPALPAGPAQSSVTPTIPSVDPPPSPSEARSGPSLLSPTATPLLVSPQPILEIPLDGPAASSRAEFSGMAWHGDSLVLLPQYPQRFGSGEGAFFVLERAEIEAFINGTTPGPLTPRLLPLDAPGLLARFPGYQGLESIVFDGDRLFLTVETRPTDKMLGWILTGSVEADLSLLHIDVSSAVAIEPQANINNLTDEAIVLVGQGESANLLTIYEANGRLVNPQPVAHRFSEDLTPLDPLSFPAVEYRITDATSADGEGRFWAINYFFPGDVKLKADSDPLLRLIVQNLPHVERLVEFQVADGAVRFVNTPPVYLQLLPSDARNWEGIVRLSERGFLLVTDTHPRTIFAYVAKP